MASHIFVKDISPESLAARDGNIQEGDVVLKVREHECFHVLASEEDLALKTREHKTLSGGVERLRDYQNKSLSLCL